MTTTMCWSIGNSAAPSDQPLMLPHCGWGQVVASWTAILDAAPPNLRQWNDAFGSQGVTREVANGCIPAESGPVDCGPPPPAKPQHQTGGESFPPLPLAGHSAATQREEAAAQSAGLDRQDGHGPDPWVTKDGKRTQYRDWMTDPADVITLLAWTSEKLGINYRAIEADFEHFSFDPRELPAVLFAGHNKFELNDEVRQKLARYVMDGGTIIGDACCGWTDFAESFPTRNGVDLPRPAAAKAAAGRSGLRVVLQARQLDLQERRRLDVHRGTLPGRDRLRLPHGRDLLAARSDLRLGRPRASPRHRAW